jgi:long-chain acyl-CoA synthetase
VALRHKDLGIWREYTWHEYNERSAQAGLGLKSLGVEPGDRVAILGENRPEWLFADLGAQGIGAIVVGVYSTSPSPEVEYILAHSGSVVAILEDEEQLDKVLEVQDRLPDLRAIVVMEPRGTMHHLVAGRCITFDQLIERGRTQPRESFDAMVDQLDLSTVAILVYTSGTTGPPKGAMLTHRNLHAAGETWAPLMTCRVGDELLSYLPLCHIAERLLSCICALAGGYTVSFGGGGEELVADLRDVQPTLFFGVPRVWEKMLARIEIRMSDASRLKRWNFGLWMRVGRRLASKKLSGQRLTSTDRVLERLGWVCLFRPLRERLGLARVRWAGTGAAPIAPKVLEFFWAIGVPICELYGQTEGTALATFTPIDQVKLGSVGKALPGADVRIDDDGEILIRSAGVFAGYYRNDEATRATIDADGWLHSGDVGVLDADGFLKITDRKKDIIITSGGKNIAPSWIENMLKVSPYVREAIVIGDRRKYCTALIGIELDTVGDWATRRRVPYTTYRDLTEQREVLELIGEWIEEVNETLAHVERVKYFRLIPKELDHEQGELTATQKVKRRAIAEQFGELIGEMYR